MRYFISVIIWFGGFISMPAFACPAICRVTAPPAQPGEEVTVTAEIQNIAGYDCPTSSVSLVPRNPDYLSVNPADVYSGVNLLSGTTETYTFRVNSLEVDGLHHGQDPDVSTDGVEGGYPKLGYYLEVVDGFQCDAAFSSVEDWVCLIPTAEETWLSSSEYDADSSLPIDADGWNDNPQKYGWYLFGTRLLPVNASFDGKQVREDELSASDSCFAQSGGFFNTCTISGTDWQVQGERYYGDSSGVPGWKGYDTVGWKKTAIDYYRAYVPDIMPCGCTIVQEMQMSCTNQPPADRWRTYQLNDLQFRINQLCGGLPTAFAHISSQRGTATCQSKAQ